jgi:hypothetical protein
LGELRQPPHLTVWTHSNHQISQAPTASNASPLSECTAHDARGGTGLSRGTIALGFFLGISVFSQSGKSSILGKMLKKKLTIIFMEYLAKSGYRNQITVQIYMFPWKYFFSMNWERTEEVERELFT